MTNQESIILALGVFYSRLFFIYWVFPYLLGMLIHYSLNRNFIKALGWLVLLVIALHFWVNYAFGVMMGSWGPVDPVEIRLLLWASVVMIGQSIFWAWLWRKKKSVGSLSWRTVSAVALVVSLITAIPATAVFALSAGTRYSRSSVVQERLEIAGCVPYPGSESWHQGYPYREAEFVDGGKFADEYLGLRFGVSDDFETVLDFYEEHLENEGYETRRGLLRTVAEESPRMDRSTGQMITPTEADMGPGRPSLLAIRDDGIAILVSTVIMYPVTIYWNIPADFEQVFESEYRWLEE